MDEYGRILSHYNNADENHRDVIEFFINDLGYSSMDEFLREGSNGEWQYVRWVEKAVFQQAEDWDIPLQEAVRVVSDPDSNFHRVLRMVEDNEYSPEAYGNFARFLEELELRDYDAPYDVGDTPSTGE